ncbi:MAG: toprim domain-containing protein [Alphaproteobacteria bacterium]|nr:toprim domain-containing protein [Alphaproteobacteria bacterium]
MNAATLAAAIDGRKAGGGWIARCPAHEDRTPSLSIRESDDGTLLVHCHAGCDQVRVIATLRSRGLWSGAGERLVSHSTTAPAPSRERDLSDASRTTAALSIWQSSMPAEGSLVGAYLATRGLSMSPICRLRFHPGLKHSSGGIWPAMVALVTRGSDDTPRAVHRTFIARDGAGKAPVEPPKMMLGPCRGGAVRLAPLGELLMVGEGIETCLAAMQATGDPAWAALSTSGLRTLDLPDSVHDVIVLADGDAPGEAAALDCARRWKREGRKVRIARPPRGCDFNDLLMGCADSSIGGAT